MLAVVSESELVKDLRRKGYAFPCTLCKRMWAAAARGIDTCLPMLPTGKTCAGPIGGHSFPLYEGPLTRSAIAMHCFRCGARAAQAVSSINNPDMLVGACKDHIQLLERLVLESQ